VAPHGVDQPDALVVEHGGDLVEAQADTAQRDDAVQPLDVGGE